MGMRAGLAIVFGFLVQRGLFLIVGRGQKWIQRVGTGSQHARQRGKTVGQILKNLITTVVMVGVLLYVLGVLGWDVRPLLATAGIAGVALGFGAQTLDGEPEWGGRMLDVLQVWGLESLGSQELSIRLVVRAMPGSDAHEVGRELRRRLHRAMIESGIRLGLHREIGIGAMAPHESPTPAARA